MTTTRALMVSVFAALAATAGADVWDTQSDNDNSVGTDNELIHGSMQVHDLGALPGPARDEDWYLLEQKPFSSYEIVVDETSGDIASGKGPFVDRVAFDGSTVLQTSEPIGTTLGFARSMRFRNTTASEIGDQYLRIISSNCTTDCGADDRYRIRAYETTYAIPRFSNVNGQGTVVLIQNPTNYPIRGTLVFWNAAGQVLHQQAIGTTAPPPAPPGTFEIAPHALYVFATTSVGALANLSGSITLLHNGRYGDLVGKAVALEPATGFSFDTPMSGRPR
jgi:hypothetical protein